VSTFNPDLAGDPERFDILQKARLVLRVYEEFLSSPVYIHKIDINGLTKIAVDEKLPVRERRRALEVLLGGRLKATAELAHLLGVRELSLVQIQAAYPGSALQAPPQIIFNVGLPAVLPPRAVEEVTDVDVLLAGSAVPAPGTNGHATPGMNGHAKGGLNGKSDHGATGPGLPPPAPESGAPDAPPAPGAAE
jgi:hypothetical protein